MLAISTLAWPLAAAAQTPGVTAESGAPEAAAPTAVAAAQPTPAQTTVAAAGQAEQAQPGDAPAADASALESRLEEVDQRARIAERKIELLEEQAAVAKTTAPVITAGERGFNFRSADGAFLVKVRGLVHADGRELLDDPELSQRDTFIIRRARPILEATFFDVADFRLMPDFGNGTAVVQDAYVDARPVSWLKLRAGKYKPPVGLERLQSATAIVFPERAFPTNLVPNRDVGFMLHGVLGPQLVSYEAGVFNGVVDGGNGDVDVNRAKDFAGRLFLQPFKYDPYNVFANLGLGFAATTGIQRGTAAAFRTTTSASGATTTTRTATAITSLPSYRSVGQMTIFSYLVNDDAPDSTVIARGRRTRLAPQGYYYYGPFGLLGEYVRASHRVEKGADTAKLTHSAWQAAAFFVFGGKQAFEGVTVTSPFDPKKGTWGALELAARYNVVDFDDDSFPTFANPARSVRAAQAIGGVANWHWSRNLKLTLSYEYTAFDGGADAGADRPSEHALFQRLQAAF